MLDSLIAQLLRHIRGKSEAPIGLKSDFLCQFRLLLENIRKGIALIIIAELGKNTVFLVRGRCFYVSADKGPHNRHDLIRKGIRQQVRAQNRHDNDHDPSDTHDEALFIATPSAKQNDCY